MSPELQTIVSFIPLFGIIFSPIITYYLSVRLEKHKVEIDSAGPDNAEITRSKRDQDSDIVLRAYMKVKEDYEELNRSQIRLEIENTQLKEQVDRLEKERDFLKKRLSEL